ncbi:hypothetical protein BDV37DRAFT_282465 [Aspergillus pseudonomiae]|uniref:Uncharacterized protein n=1 Tax=Aspergillus pseudonomiae TaxID=1506151 RepID=A0A5N7DER0_9EURO|nr:uncharacterized protein BDV37DRAFT_282465 [Aspergillus pseudonomiae]KAE8404936.1 hypothetical protein BDV37DRAFT_282465 [Aspergillus pseudonomiae]
MPALELSALGSQRKAQEELREPQTRRPGAVSIRAILQTHSRTRLYVRPIAWVADHLRLLQCYFRPLEAEDSCGQSSCTASPKPKSRRDPGNVWRRMPGDITQNRAVDVKSKDAILAATRLCRPTSLAVPKLALETILESFNNFPLPSKCLSLYSHGRHAVQLRTDNLFTGDSISPTLAYISFDPIKRLRSDYVDIPRCDPLRNVPVSNIKQKRLRWLESQRKVEDPYVVAISMALAQEQRRMQQARQKKQGSEVIPMNNPETLEAQVNGYANCGGTQVNAENPMPYLDVGISTPHAASSFKRPRF